MNFGTSRLKKKPPTRYIFQEGCIEEEITIVQKFVMLQEKDVCKTTWYKIMGILKSIYMSYKHESKRGCRIQPHQNKGSQKH
jgi:hypothetical protein